jgi:hypothetical protein
MPKARYMRKQRDINHSMRSILVDWLVEVAQEYKLNSQTLFIAIGYIDRFLSEMSVQRTKLQLVGVTAMLLAAKYEEIYPPAVDEFVYITDNTYNRDQVNSAERFNAHSFRTTLLTAQLSHNRAGGSMHTPFAQPCSYHNLLSREHTLHYTKAHPDFLPLKHATELTRFLRLFLFVCCANYRF